MVAGVAAESEKDYKGNRRGGRLSQKLRGHTRAGDRSFLPTEESDSSTTPQFRFILAGCSRHTVYLRWGDSNLLVFGPDNESVPITGSKKIRKGPIAQAW